jgi:hypothetical protein
MTLSKVPHSISINNTTFSIQHSVTQHINKNTQFSTSMTSSMASFSISINYTTFSIMTLSISIKIPDIMYNDIQHINNKYTTPSIMLVKC